MHRHPTQPAHLAAQVEAFLTNLLGNDSLFRGSADVGQKLAPSNSADDPKAVATEVRRAKRVIGVWDGEKYRYPIFQFDDTGHPLSDIPALIAVLPRDNDGSNRAAALWLFSPNAALGRRTPAEVFREDPKRVLALARHWHEGGSG